MQTDNMIKAFTDFAKAGEAALTENKELKDKLVAVEATLCARNTYIEDTIKAHGARESELQREIDRLRLAEQQARDDLGVMTGRVQAFQTGAAGIMRPAPAANTQGQRAIGKALDAELTRAPDKPEKTIEPQTDNVIALDKVG